MKILFLSTHKVTCGIADYNSSMMEAASLRHDCDIEAFPQKASLSERDIQMIAARAIGYDAVIIQHEWSFIEQNLSKHYDRLRYLLKCLRKNSVTTGIIMHSDFVPLPPRRNVKHWVDLARRFPLIREINKYKKLKLFVHGRRSVNNMLEQGIKLGKIERIVHPHREQSSGYSERRNSDDVTLAIFGFVSDYKGYETALYAMRLLPDNYRLVIAGSQHPLAMHDLTYENILGFIRTGIWLQDNHLPKIFKRFTTKKESDAFSQRIVITGYLSHNAIFQELAKADIVIAPYFGRNAPAGSGAVQWAISSGKPTIVSAVHTFEEYIEAGCVVPVTPGAPHHLAQAIKMLASSVQDQNALSVAALAFARENSFYSITERILSNLASLSNRRHQ